MRNDWAKVRPSFVLASLACLVLLPSSAHIGDFAAARVAYRYEQSRSLSVLDRQGSQELGRLGRSAYALTFPQVLSLPKTRRSFEQSLAALEKIRPKIVPELLPLIDLRIAENHAVLGKLEARSNSLAHAADHLRVAQDLLRSLGWQDVSESTLNELADRQIRPAGRSELQR